MRLCERDKEYILLASAAGDIAKVQRFLNKYNASLSLDQIINAADRDGNTILMRAARFNREEVVNLLLIRGANVNARNNGGTTALMWAASEGNTKIVKVLLDNGAEIDAIDRDGSTALIFAARFLQFETTQLLTARGANRDIRNKDGKTALMEGEETAAQALTAYVLDELFESRSSHPRGARRPKGPDLKL